MPGELNLHQPWLVAVWPGIGHVALNAGVYLLAKLGMKVVAQLETGDLFEIEHVEVRAGLVQPVRRPRNRFFVWKDPANRHDLLVFVGEAQPPLGKFQLCRQIIAYAKTQGVERVFTFAAMATQMHPSHGSRVFGAATDGPSIEEFKRLEIEPLEDGQVSGLNGLLLAAAAEAGLRGSCLLGEMPHIFAQLPFPKASQAILEVFATMSGIELNLAALKEQADAVDQQLGELLVRLEQQHEAQRAPRDEEESAEAEPELEPEAPSAADRISPEDRRRIEVLFREASRDRAKAFELKQELDRLGAFREFEDRFLDLFKDGA